MSFRSLSVLDFLLPSFPLKTNLHLQLCCRQALYCEEPLDQRVLTNSKHFPFSSAVASIWSDQLSLSGSSGSMNFISLHAVNWVWFLILYESVSTKVLPFLNINRLED